MRKFRFGLRPGFGLLMLLCALSLSVPKIQAQCVDGQYSDLDQGSYLLQNDEWGLGGGPVDGRKCVPEAPATTVGVPPGGGPRERVRSKHIRALFGDGSMVCGHRTRVDFLLRSRRRHPCPPQYPSICMAPISMMSHTTSFSVRAPTLASHRPS